MNIYDLIFTPFYLAIFYALAFWLRPKFTNKVNRKYFIPALTLKLIGAIAVGLIYWFYYGNGSASGDTFNFYKHIEILYEAFKASPSVWLKLMLSKGEFDSDTAQYASRLLWYNAPTEFLIVKIGSLFSILCFNTYTVIAIFFAIFSFLGIWQLFATFFRLFPILHNKFAIACFYLPSVFFWGSGLLKDSITMGALGWLFFGFYQATIEKKKVITSTIIIIISATLIYSIKAYILISFIPPALYWVFLENNNRIKSPVLRKLAIPFFLSLGILAAYIGVTNLTEGNTKYDIDKLGEQSRINTTYLSKQVYTGSAYDIGIFDGSLGSLLTVGPQAVNVALYRPYLWEVKNPVMLLSAIEATLFIFLTASILLRTGLFKSIRLISSQPILTFCFVFSIILAFGVGTNSGNFGTLVRYKIPFMPFYLSALYIMNAYVKKRKKSSQIRTLVPAGKAVI